MFFVKIRAAAQRPIREIRGRRDLIELSHAHRYPHLCSQAVA
jgi:hypothetical protein